ncbi:ABC transporter permease [Paenibacillus soyae]|uniref:ABC transporter permease subunit n=1 Tax=Paenibacillus soyae TaxID=2969249 RepID=A0A9X2MQ51_9BACL|nr:ABC transporter permease subunit [Paenibacillus soyae]MCR2803823.1 ABC transporter permease subunit [Paenibacillus soyae]
MEIKTTRRKRIHLRRFLPLYLMMIPGLLYLLINNYLPMFGLSIAFKNVNYAQGIWGSDWVGISNFEYLFRTTDAYIITRNTLLYNAVFIVLGLTIAIAIAILLNEIRSKMARGFYQSVILLPYLISMILVSYLVYALLSPQSGFMNKTILPMFGLDPISWYLESKYWPYILTIVHIWKGAGYSCIVFLAAIIGIDREYYEAAELDGATKWMQIRKITLPMITPIITMLALLGIGRIFYSDFGLFYQVPMNSGALYETTNVIDTYVFRGLLQIGDIGMSAAAGFYQSLVGFVLVLVSNYIVRRFDKDNALF